MIHADIRLATRLESLCAREMRRFAETAQALEPGCGACWMEVAGGIAAFVAPASPVNMAFGLGMSGSVDGQDIQALEHFYLEKGARPAAGVCPLAHPSLVEVLCRRGWVVDSFENVLVRAYRADEEFPIAAAGIEIREAVTEEDRDLWALAAATGFSAPLPPLADQLALGHVVVNRPGTRLFIAFVDGQAAGTGELFVEQGVAWLSGDATLPRFRGRGVQQTLQLHRLRLGAGAGCALAVSEAAPGSGSQRNMERAGFRVAYTRVDMLGPLEDPQSEEGIAQ